MSIKFNRLFFVAGSLLAYIVGCVTPALHLVGKENTLGERSYVSGLAAFIDGIFALFDGQLAWLANPLGLLALVLLLCRCYRSSVVFALAGVVVAQHTWVLVGTKVVGDEGGVTKYLVTSLGVGFYLWVFAFVLVGVGSLLAMYRMPEAMAEEAPGMRD